MREKSVLASLSRPEKTYCSSSSKGRGPGYGLPPVSDDVGGAGVRRSRIAVSTLMSRSRRQGNPLWRRVECGPASTQLGGELIRRAPVRLHVHVRREVSVEIVLGLFLRDSVARARLQLHGDIDPLKRALHRAHEQTKEDAEGQIGEAVPDEE